MSTQMICDNCRAMLDVWTFQIGDGRSGERLDACSAECAVALVVREEMYQAALDAAVDELGEDPSSEAIDEAVDGLRDPYDALVGVPAPLAAIEAGIEDLLRLAQAS